MPLSLLATMRLQTDLIPSLVMEQRNNLREYSIQLEHHAVANLSVLADEPYVFQITTRIHYESISKGLKSRITH